MKSNSIRNVTWIWKIPLTFISFEFIVTTKFLVNNRNDFVFSHTARDVWRSYIFIFFFRNFCLWILDCRIQVSLRVARKESIDDRNRFQRSPPLRVDDLIEDLKDGTRLLALLEVLSGEKLVSFSKRLSCNSRSIKYARTKRVCLFAAGGKGPKPEETAFS